jgi:hypothetical protein
MISPVGYGIQALLGNVQSIGYDPSSTPGNERLYVVSSESGRHLWQIDVQTGRAEALWGEFNSASACISPDGFWNEIKMCGYSSLAISPDRRFIYVGGFGMPVYVAD